MQITLFCKKDDFFLETELIDRTEHETELSSLYIFFLDLAE